MARFDRYMLSQLVMLFGFYGLVLVLLFWVNRAVRLFDQLITSGQTTLVFLEFSAMIIPGVIIFIIPIAAFAASISVTNRLNSESELVAAQAAGFSPFRLALPVLVFGIITGVFMLLLTHILAPMSQLRLGERKAEVAQNVTTRFLTPGRFVNPVDGVSLYIRDISPAGELEDLFLSDERNPEQVFTYTARKALVVKTKKGPRLIMFDGLVQGLTRNGERLSTTQFDEFSYDISQLITTDSTSSRSIKQIYTSELLNPTALTLEQTGKTRTSLRAEAHFRNAQALYSVITALSGFSMLIVAGFSRFGLWRQVVFALGAMILLQTLDNTMLDLARRSDAGLWLVYFSSLVGGLFNIAVLFISSWPSVKDLLRRRKTLQLQSDAENKIKILPQNAGQS